MPIHTRAVIFSACCVVAAVGHGNEEVAKAYLQAVTQGNGPRTALSVNYDALGCNPRTIWADNCQQAVLQGKDGKTLFMESITPAPTTAQWRNSNIMELLPEEDLARVFSDRLSPTQQLLTSLSTQGNGWYGALEGEGNAKAILRAYIADVSSRMDPGEAAGNLYTSFSGESAAQAPQDLQAVAVQIDLRIDVFEQPRPLSGLYFWALQVGMTDMQYPPGYAGIAEQCLGSTKAWGHVGLQFHASSGRRAANWGGGGQGDGTADYGCGGSDVSDFQWQVGTWYRLSVIRGEQIADQLWEWYGTIEGGNLRPYGYAIHGGEYLVPYGFVVWTEAIDLNCDDPEARVSWGRPVITDASGRRHTVSSLRASYSTDKVCAKSNQRLTGANPAIWTQEMGRNTVRTTPNSTELLAAPAAPSGLDVN